MYLYLKVHYIWAAPPLPGHHPLNLAERPRVLGGNHDSHCDSGISAEGHRLGLSEAK